MGCPECGSTAKKHQCYETELAWLVDDDLPVLWGDGDES